jgi:hypothetical protein
MSVLKTNNFEADLKFSQEAQNEACWLEAYKKAFGDFDAAISHHQDGYHQRAGVDRSVIFKNTKRILIDEKIRRIEDTGDILLEYISNDRTGAPGWVEKPLLADWIAYAFFPSGTAYMLPVLQLQKVWRENKDSWIRKYRKIQARNSSYFTINVPVPTRVLMDCINGALSVTFKTPQERQEERQIELWFQ